MTPPEASTVEQTPDVHICDVSLRRAFGFLGKRWNGVILATIGARGPVGFADLKRGVTGITDSMLSDRLTELASINLVVRSVTTAKPPAVTYALTEEGKRLLPVFDQLARWAHDNLRECPSGA
ncbi:winged helix-turn-helix transcriptional regulator [Umezawaea endophytica]|uniref:Helix-turn-helix transcriptional regulator n=1 Tax=Umezawaea endophytica TaxID=1654476 RepID=A0A9X3AHC6_9PSEU|nr:helix-turn-helix domain-containing protein [Umezawaea endophytica]MCS7479250.1 helix-turn-helix transcriptional regulator [Umezawaea endophytica]